MVYLPSTLAGLGEFAEAMSFNNPYMGFTHCVCLSWYPLKELKSITPLVSGFSMNDQVQISLPVNNKTRPKKKKKEIRNTSLDLRFIASQFTIALKSTGAFTSI